MKIKNDQWRMRTTLILLLAPAQSVTMERVMIQIIWEPVTQRTDTHKTERPELLDDPLQLVGRRCGLLDSEIVPPPGAAHKSRSSSGCLGQLVSWQAVEKNMNHLCSCQWMPSIVGMCYNNLNFLLIDVFKRFVSKYAFKLKILKEWKWSTARRVYIMEETQTGRVC